jgi:signal transduction histidine kinase
VNRWNRLAGDAALAAALAAVLVGQAVAIAASWGGRYWVFDGAAGLAGCALALVRRRHRAWAAAAGLTVAAVAVLVARLAPLPAEPGPALALALAVLVGSAVRVLPARRAGGIAAAGLAVVVASWLAHPGSPVPAVNAITWLGGAAAGLGSRRLAARRRAATERVRRDERLELARELHDVVAHHITGIVVQAQAAQLVAGRRPERLGEALAGIEAAGTDALAAMRRVVSLLRDADDAAPATPGPERLSDLVARFEGPAVHLAVPEGEPAWPPEVTTTVYRIVQESLTNIARHAPLAGSVSVRVAEEPRAVTVEVADDAPPAPARHRRGGYGLVGMRERVETLGGTLHAGPRPGAGWSVRARLPR